MLFLVTLLGLIAAVMVGMTVSDTMRMEDYIRLGVVFSPLMLVAVLAMRRHWLGVAIGLIPYSFALPVQIIGSFGLNVIMGCMIFALVLGAYTMGNYRSNPFNNLPSVLMFIAFVFVLARILYDRPGSAMLGGAGGGRQAVTMLFAFFVFWAFSKIAAESDWTPMRALWVIFLIPGIDLIRKFVKMAILNGDPMFFLSKFYTEPSWILGSLVFAFIIFRFGFGKGPTLLHQNLFLASNALLALSAMGTHRSRPLFAMGTIMVVAYVFQYHRKVLIHLSLAAIVGILVIFSMGREQMPATLQRTLSVFFPVESQELIQTAQAQGIGVNAEVGWESEFRTKLYRLAWRKISGNPLFGDGFSFSTQDLTELYATSDGKMDDRTQRLAMVGGYHNSWLQLAVGAGLPAAICAAIAMLMLCWKSVEIGLRQTDLKMKFFCAALAGMLPPFMGQMLMNGDAKNFFMCSMLLGVVNGLRVNPKFNPLQDEPAIKEVDETLVENEIEAEEAAPELQPVPYRRASRGVTSSE